MINDVVKVMRTTMDKSIENFKSELTKIRTGRASTAMLDGIKVDYYGTPTVISQVASVSCPEPKMIVVQPWEVNLLKDIETAIQKSDIGITPMNDGKVIRLKIPDLTEERGLLGGLEAAGILMDEYPEFGLQSNRELATLADHIRTVARATPDTGR